jgi:hypothetical protein
LIRISTSFFDAPNPFQRRLSQLWRTPFNARRRFQPGRAGQLSLRRLRLRDFGQVDLPPKRLFNKVESVDDRA